MLIGPSKQTVPCVKHVINIASFFVTDTNLQIAFDINDSSKFEISSTDLKRYQMFKSLLTSKCVLLSFIGKLQLSRAKNSPVKNLIVWETLFQYGNWKKTPKSNPYLFFPNFQKKVKFLWQFLIIIYIRFLCVCMCAKSNQQIQKPLTVLWGTDINTVCMSKKLISFK